MAPPAAFSQLGHEFVDTLKFLMTLCLGLMFLFGTVSLCAKYSKTQIIPTFPKTTQCPAPVVCPTERMCPSLAPNITVAAPAHTQWLLYLIAVLLINLSLANWPVRTLVFRPYHACVKFVADSYFDIRQWWYLRQLRSTCGCKSWRTQFNKNQ